MSNTPKPLHEIDIVMSIYNQESIIEHILAKIIENTSTPFRLILIFDGCTDSSQAKATDCLSKSDTGLMRQLLVETAPNVYETRANNKGFRMVASEFFITLQDDMAINEWGWEKRLTFPLRSDDRLFAVSARMAMDIKAISRDKLVFQNKAGRELLNISRNTLAIRDVINRGPIAFSTQVIRELDYLNEDYAPSDLDDADLCMRAFRDRGYLCGTYWIDYISKPQWSKAKAKDSTMQASQSQRKNIPLLIQDHEQYLIAGKKHSFNITIPAHTIDYTDHRKGKIANVNAKKRLLAEAPSIALNMTTKGARQLMGNVKARIMRSL